MDNLLAMLLNLLKGGGLDQIARLVGLSGDTDKTHSAVQGAAAALLAGLIQKASTPTGVNAVFDMVKDRRNDGSLLDNLPDILGNPQKSEDLIRGGTESVRDILGPKTDALSSALGSALGLGKAVLGPLLGLIAPLLLNLIGKQVLAKALNPQALLSLLLGQKDFLKTAMPQGLTSALGLASLDDLGRAESGGVEGVRHEAARGMPETRTPVRTAAVEETPPFLKYLLPLGLLALLALGGYYGLQSCAAPEERVDDGAALRPPVAQGRPSADPAIRTGADDALNKIQSGVDQAVAAVSSLDLPGGVKIDVPRGGVLERLFTVLSNPTGNITDAFHLDVVAFEPDSNTPTATALAGLELLATVLKAFPTVEIAVVGHTDNTGDATARKEESLQKATAIRAELVKRGVDETRITADGMGGEQPVADNATPDGRAKNNRIELRVTKR
jgi:outer membrane protein OmpA-like peptidoglycan-associated protein